MQSRNVPPVSKHLHPPLSSHISSHILLHPTFPSARTEFRPGLSVIPLFTTQVSVHFHLYKNPSRCPPPAVDRFSSSLSIDCIYAEVRGALIEVSMPGPSSYNMNAFEVTPKFFETLCLQFENIFCAIDWIIYAWAADVQSHNVRVMSSVFKQILPCSKIPAVIKVA